MSPADLQLLIRLHREGVEGAAQELLAIVDASADELSQVFGLPSDQVRALGIDGIGVALENTRRASRRQRASQGLDQARVLATEVSAGLRRSSGITSVPIETFVALVLAPGYRYLAFTGRDGPCGLDKTVLARFLRACRRARLELITLEGYWLKVLYRTGSSRGRVRFILGPIPEDEAILIDCSRLDYDPTRDVVEAPQPPAVAARSAPPEESRTRPRRTDVEMPGFWAHLFRAIEEAVYG